MPTRCFKLLPRLTNPLVWLLLTKMARMNYHRAWDTNCIPLAPLANVTEPASSVKYLCELLRGNLQDQNFFSIMKNNIKKDAAAIFSIKNLPQPINPAQFPTKVESRSQQVFGKNHPLKLYTVLPLLTQVAVIVWKYGYLDSELDRHNSVTLAKLLLCGETTLAMLVELPSINLKWQQDLMNVFLYSTDYCCYIYVIE